ncbi:hypothetical protein LshimejAT787_0801380 [Lyophyllum shimeji]|uniref:Uncharacterized protein n=1 Tax=Lyophyllum shimeji TaxID=47721 RepID=A0A9P3PPI4_LYOSH|nr:hypothetical protein LshimejAT787_0801380 [Lyophyllum shimeji]
MPTATSALTTTTYSSRNPLKGTISVTASLSSSSTSTTTTLRTLYKRAAPAFLQRDFPLAQSLIEAAFEILRPPEVIPDVLEEYRRKWDVLRITLECTVHSAPPPPESLPQSLKGNQLLSPQNLLSALYHRSLSLFTPAKDKSNVNPGYLPSQVLLTLIYSSLRLDCPDVGRIMIEEWLSWRDVPFPGPQDGETTASGYEKVLELYCLQILPKLEQWDYAREFLEYEGELCASVQECLKTTLKSMQTTALSSPQSQHVASLSPVAAEASFRASSPAPSTSSSSSSLSTTSTNTVVPSTARGAQHSHTTAIPSTSTNGSTTSLSSDSTATPRSASRRPVLKSRSRESSSTPVSAHISSLPRSSPQTAALTPPGFNVYSLVKAALAPYLTTSSISTFFLLFIAFPLVSLLLRARNRSRRPLAGPRRIHSNADVVRRRLKGAGELGFVGRAWGEVVRARNGIFRVCTAELFFVPPCTST